MKRSADYNKKKIIPDALMKTFVMNNGVAHIVARVDGVGDVVDHYSVKDYEFLSQEFTSFLDWRIRFVPRQAPVVLEITGCRLTDAEKEAIENAVWNYYEMALLGAQKEKKRLLWRILWLLLFLLAAGAIYAFVENTNAKLIAELVYVTFWFSGDRLMDSAILQREEDADARRRMAQLGSMKVIFTERFEDAEFTDEEVEEYTEEIIENTESTEV